MDQSTQARPGNWKGLVLLVSGGSTMGKSFFAKTVLSTEYGAVYRQVDNIYTAAVNDAKMVIGDIAVADVSDSAKRHAERDARRRARDRKWPNEEAKSRFFASFKKQIRKVCREGHQNNTAVVIEGGTLRKKEEVELVARCARDVHGPDARLIRVTVEVPYDRWLQNRVHRMLKSGVETTFLKKLSPDTYAAEAKAATPKPHRDVIDHKVRNLEDLHSLMAQLSQADASAVLKD